MSSIGRRVGSEFHFSAEIVRDDQISKAFKNSIEKLVCRVEGLSLDSRVLHGVTNLRMDHVALVVQYLDIVSYPVLVIICI